MNLSSLVKSIQIFSYYFGVQAMFRQVDKAGIDLIKSFEGLKLTAYVCEAGRWTVGYGHTGKDVYKGVKITESYALNLLYRDISVFEKTINNLDVNLSQNEFNALVSLVFNIGRENFRTSTIKKLLLVHADKSRIAQEFVKWKYVSKYRKDPDTNQLIKYYVVSQGLLNRRKKEQSLFLTPDKE